jgi:quercetin dioxygenase-like cupin family protein
MLALTPAIWTLTRPERRATPLRPNDGTIDGLGPTYPTDTSANRYTRSTTMFISTSKRTKQTMIRAARHTRKIRYGIGIVSVFAALAGATLWPAPSGAAPSRDSPAALVTQDGHGGHDHHEQNEDGITFGPAPAVFPAGAEMAVLQGDPSVAGAIFTVRLRLPNGYVIPAHWHPTDENVTVISGRFLVGLGDRFDKEALLPPLRAGGFITAPANANHFATAKGRTIVQVHAIGPFEMTYVNPADDPRTHG